MHYKPSIAERKKLFAKIMKKQEELEAKENREAFAQLPLAGVAEAKWRIETRDRITPTAEYYSSFTKEHRAEISPPSTLFVQVPDASSPPFVAPVCNFAWFF
ncbi:90d0e165-233d-411b-a3fd-a1ef4d7cfbc8 [Sclerotinia trifoliorum]|uniref:90d0e165-233d-411b-a3fd-a1ef4d7cfbc8 n=1 Tax=Sclerotinia trifoliorum TaxID=28548 RepID=A0A8H2ZXR1_9HELO|nr:90d0e165-233d-411b-a3fd-a1ef4d7cfbc8 [Sclerotinia trifoliorum]